jgi:hypothetical protein
VRRLTPPFIFSAVAVLVTWPLTIELTSRLGALQGPGDPFLNLWVLGWDLRTISTHPAWLLTGRVFDANIFYPSSQALAYSDHQLLQSLAVWPIYAITHNITLCYNAVLILSLILSAWAMYAFARVVTGSRIAAFGAGLAWGFCPFHMTQLPHVQLQALYWMPLTFLLLHRLLLGRHMRDAIWHGVGAVGFILSLGPDGIRPLYAMLHQWVFGFQAVRAPARFAVLVLFALAFLAGLGVDSLARASHATSASRWLLAPLALLLMAVELLNGSVPWTAAPPVSTPTGRWLQLASEPGPVVYLPIGNEGHDTTVMVASLEHGRPIVNGYSGQRPPLYDGLVEQMASFPAADALLTLHDLGIRFVIAAAPVSPARPASPLVERARLIDGVVYELRWTSEVEAALEETADVTPLPPGRRTFPIGEMARYQIRWLGGPMTVPAGEAVAQVERSDDDGFRFTVHAITAN